MAWNEGESKQGVVSGSIAMNKETRERKRLDQKLLLCCDSEGVHGGKGAAHGRKERKRTNWLVLCCDTLRLQTLPLSSRLIFDSDQPTDWLTDCVVQKKNHNRNGSNRICQTNAPSIRFALLSNCGPRNAAWVLLTSFLTNTRIALFWAGIVIRRCSSTCPLLHLISLFLPFVLLFPSASV